jgi:uncharacterized protein with HEPN domain
MKGLITDKTRVLHILEAISAVEKYLHEVSYDEFHVNSEKKFATIKQIEIVGEACNSLSTEFKEAHAEIAWKPIRGFRNISIHEYFAVDFYIVWEIATNDLPVLKKQFNAVLLNWP